MTSPDTRADKQMKIGTPRNSLKQEVYHLHLLNCIFGHNCISIGKRSFNLHNKYKTAEFTKYPPCFLHYSQKTEYKIHLKTIFEMLKTQPTYSSSELQNQWQHFGTVHY